MKAYGVLALAGVAPSPPTVPQNVAAVALSSSAIRLTWSASTDQVGVTGYQIYRDSTPLTTTGGLSFDDITCAPATTYAYRLAAFNAAGALSALSAEAIATTPGLPANSDPEWNDTISESLSVGNAYSRPLDEVCTDADGDDIEYSASAVQETPPATYTQGLPPGVTLNVALGTLSGVPTTAGKYAYTIDADDGVGAGPDIDDMDADFAARATAAGCMYACNATNVWVSRVLQPSRTITDSTSLRNEALDLGGTPTNCVRDTVRKLSGTGSIQLITPGSAGVDGGAHWSYRLNGTDSTQFTRFYAQMSIYQTRDGLAYRYQLDSTSQPQQLKLWNIEQNGSGQIAICARRFLGFISYFCQDGGGFNNSGDASFGTPNPWSSSQEWIQNAIDNSGATPSTKDQYIARYGPLSGISGDVSGAVGGQPVYSAGDPYVYNRSWPSSWPDTRAIAAGAVPFNLDGWTTIGIFVDYNVSSPGSSTFQGWAAPYGFSPTLIFNQIGNCPLGSNDVYRRLELLSYDTHRVSETGVRPEIRTNYTEVLVSSAPIKFPGNFTLPNNQG